MDKLLFRRRIGRTESSGARRASWRGGGRRHGWRVGGGVTCWAVALGEVAPAARCRSSALLDWTSDGAVSGEGASEKTSPSRSLVRRTLTISWCRGSLSSAGHVSMPSPAISSMCRTSWSIRVQAARWVQTSKVGLWWGSSKFRRARVQSAAAATSSVSTGSAPTRGLLTSSMVTATSWGVAVSVSRASIAGTEYGSTSGPDLLAGAGAGAGVSACARRICGPSRRRPPRRCSGSTRARGSPGSAVVVGVGTEGVRRRDVAGPRWWRLGPGLVHAAAGAVRTVTVS